MKLITVKSAHSQTELVVLKSRLESEGIECFFKNELTAQILNYLPAFRVELQVSDQELPRVEEIMAEIGDSIQEGKKVVCPECGSEKIKMKVSLIKGVKIFFAIVGTMLFNYLPVDKLFKNVKFSCSDCKHIFNS